MNRALLQKLKENLNTLLEKGIFDHSEIVLFGMNTPGDKIIQFLEAKGYQVSMIVDNNPANYGKRLFNIPVYNPEKLQKPLIENLVVLISSRYYVEMCKQLESMGYQENKHIFQVLTMNQEKIVSDSENIWKENLNKMRKYLEIFKYLSQKYKKNTYFLLCPVCANGDVYITAALMNIWKKQHNISNHSVLVVIGTIGKKIASMFDKNYIEVISQEDMEALTILSRFLGKEAFITVVHPSQFYFSIFPSMEGFRQLNFMNFMASGVLNIKKPYVFSVKRNKKTKISFTGREIILAPYANSVPDFPLHFWEMLTKNLQEKGYFVYTNGDGELEPAIKGTQAIFLPIDEMCSVLEQCAAFIAIRNGLCDLVAEADCKKIILYPDKATRFSTIRDYYGLKNMELLKNGIEMVYKEQKEKELLQEILSYIA